MSHFKKLTIFGIFNQLLSTKIVNVARFARNIECDFFFHFQTLCGEDLLSSLQAIEQVVGSAPILDSDGSACLFAEISLRSEAQL